MKKDIRKQNEKGWKMGKSSLARSKKGYTGSLLPFLFFNLAIMTAVFLTVTDCAGAECSNPYTDDTNDFFDSFLNFTSWGDSTWTQWLIGALSSGSAVLISAAILGWKSEFPIFAGFAGLMFTTFLPTYTTVYTVLTDAFGNEFIAMLFLSPIAVGWIIILAEYARGRD